MSKIHGCNTIMFLTKNLVILLLIFMFRAPVMVAGRENPLVELSSKEDLVSSVGYGDQKLSTVLITGSVLCDQPCISDQNTRRRQLGVSGASVSVACQTSWKTSKSNWVQVKTDEFGDFLVDLPSHLHAIPNLDKRCLVKVIQLPNSSPCRIGFTGKLAELELSSVHNTIRTYVAKRLHLSPRPSKGCQHRRAREGENIPLVKAY